MLLEVFADIAYSTGSGYKSIQGLVICFGGSPIAWQSSSQPFVTHSTAEAELVSYCEALTAGRATEALICTGENKLERVIYGDNAAAISLAYGNSNTSWRTRHLRVRSNILKEALEDNNSYPGGSWQLHHLKGTELVADGMTKPLARQSFAGFIHDLGLKKGEIQVKSLGLGQGAPQQPDHSIALQTLFVGTMMVRVAEAQGGEESETTFVRRLQAVPSKPFEPQDPYEVEELVHTTPLRRRRARGLEQVMTPQQDDDAVSTEEEAVESERTPARRSKTASSNHGGEQEQGHHHVQDHGRPSSHQRSCPGL